MHAQQVMRHPTSPQLPAAPMAAFYPHHERHWPATTTCHRTHSSDLGHLSNPHRPVRGEGTSRSHRAARRGTGAEMTTTTQITTPSAPHPGDAATAGLEVRPRLSRRRSRPPPRPRRDLRWAACVYVRRPHRHRHPDHRVHGTDAALRPRRRRHRRGDRPHGPPNRGPHSSGRRSP